MRSKAEIEKEIARLLSAPVFNYKPINNAFSSALMGQIDALAWVLKGGEELESDKQKPPLGIMPEDVWKRQRAEELAQTIGRYIFTTGYEHLVVGWCRELEDLIRGL